MEWEAKQKLVFKLELSKEDVEDLLGYLTDLRQSSDYDGEAKECLDEWLGALSEMEQV